MGRISKLDYFVGVFVSTLLKSAKGVPALFDETENSKSVTFLTDLGEFNVYIKYSTSLSNKPKNIKGKVKNKMSCNISFNDNDYDILKNKFKLPGYQNLVALVCANNDLSETKIAILPYNDAMSCLRYFPI